MDKTKPHLKQMLECKPIVDRDGRPVVATRVRMADLLGKPRRYNPFGRQKDQHTGQ